MILDGTLVGCNTYGINILDGTINDLDPTLLVVIHME